MDSLLISLCVFGLLAALANVLGGAVLLPTAIRRNFRGSLQYLLALGAGFMLAVTFLEVVPKSVLLWQEAQSETSLAVPMLLLLAGYLLTQFFEHTIAPHFHLGEEVGPETVIASSSAYSGVAGFIIHTFFDGVSIAAASQLDIRVGFLVFVAVFLHKFPEGFTIGSMMLAAGKGKKEVLMSTALLGAATMLGIAVFVLLGMSFKFSVAYALPLASGVTLYVAASDLIPEVNHHGGRRPIVSICVFAGVALFFLIHTVINEIMPH